MRRRLEAWGAPLVALVAVALLIVRVVFVTEVPDLDTDAYGHHVIARVLADHPRDVAANWVWLPLFHYLQAIAIRFGATLDTIRIVDAVITAAIPLLLYAFLRRRRRSTPDEGSDATPLLSALLCALSPIGMQMGTTGQTEPLFSLLVLVTIALLDARRWGWVTVVVTALCLLRYEAWAILPAIVAVRIYDAARHRRSSEALSLPPSDRDRPPRAPWLWPIFVPLVAIFGWAAIRAPVDGKWFWFLSATKEFARDAQQQSGPASALGLLRDLVYYPVIVPFACFGWPLLLSPFGLLRTFRREGSRFSLVYLSILGFVSYAWLTRSSLGLYRHLVVLLPFYSTMIANGIVTLARAVGELPVVARTIKAPARLVVALLGVSSLVLTARTMQGWMSDWRRKGLAQWPERRAIAAYLQTIPSSDPIFCDEPTIEVLSGLDRRRFDRRRLIDDEATRRALTSAAPAGGAVWIASFRRSIGALDTLGEVVLPRLDQPVGQPPGQPVGEAVVLVRITPPATSVPH